MEVNSLTLADDSLGPQGIVQHEVLLPRPQSRLGARASENSQTAKQA